MRTNKFAIVGMALCVGTLTWFTGCEKKETGEFLGSAVVEVDTWQVPALVQGPLLATLKEEGDPVAAGELLAVIDTLPYALQRTEALANLDELLAGESGQSRQVQSLQADLRGMQQEANRTQELVRSGAATAQQWDRISANRDAAQFRLDAARQTLQGLGSKKQALQARVQLLENQLARCRVLAPSPGIVMARYRNPGEAVAPGQSVYEIGSRDSVRVDFFVPTQEMGALHLGDTLRLRMETPAGAAHFPAVIRFISNEAEFTPKNIQTRESRAELIFRVRATAASRNGALKRGLPVEVWK